MGLFKFYWTDATNSLKTSVSNGKSSLASAITDKGVSTSSSDSFDTMASNIRSITSLDPNTLYASKYYKYRKYTFTMQYHGSELVGTKGIYSVSFEYYNVSKLTLDSSGRLMFPNSSYAGYYEAGSLNAANATVGCYAMGYGYVYQILNSSGNYYFRFYGDPSGTATVIEDIAINIDDLPGQYQCRYGRAGAIYGTDGTYYYDQIGRANYSNF